MGFLGKILAAGELTSSITALYTCPATQTAYVKYFRLFNNNVSQETIEVYVQISGQPLRKTHRVGLSTYESAEIIDKDAAWTLSPGDVIYCNGTSASGVSYIFTGGVEV